MTRLTTMLLMILAMTGAFAQLADPITFNEKTHDFGSIREEGGPAVFEFVVTNKTTRPIKIINVQPSCGCTTSGWTKEPIAPGATGMVKASYDPLHRPGYFDKTLSVTTDWDGTPVILHIKGNVVNVDAEKDPSSFTVERGSLRWKTASFHLDKIYINREPEAVVFPVYNSSTDTVHVQGFVGPRYIRMQLPKAIAPGAVASVKLLYDAKLKGQYGFVTDNIDLNTDDKVMPQKTFSVYATVEEYFPKLTDAEMAQAPVLGLSANMVKFGNVKAGVVLDREITLTNLGKKELIIRHAQSNCSCLELTPGLKTLKPGQQTTIKIRFNTQGRTGPQNKSVTIYSTDPQHPVQRITFSVGVL